MTNKDIIARIEAAGHQVPANLNRAKLEALAAEKGVNLAETPAVPVQTDLPPSDYDPGRMITPVMAVCGMSGNGAAIPLPDAGGAEAAE